MRERLRAFISQFVHEYSRTRRLETPWGEPLVGHASAIDPLFPYLQSAVSATHRMPRSLVKDARTVIVYFIPFSKMTVQSNVQGRQCSREWAVAYLETNKLIIELNQSLVHTLLQSRFAATSLSPTHNFDEQHLMSDWLHKHVAFIAGLGTFGLHRMLITEKGCCIRLGSVITTAEITPSEKPERAFCLYYDDKSCQ